MEEATKTVAIYSDSFLGRICRPHRSVILGVRIEPSVENN